MSHGKEEKTNAAKKQKTSAVPKPDDAGAGPVAEPTIVEPADVAPLGRDETDLFGFDSPPDPPGGPAASTAMPSHPTGPGFDRPPLVESSDDEPAPKAGPSAGLKPGTCPTWAVSHPVSSSHFRPSPGPCGPGNEFILTAHPDKDTMFLIFKGDIKVGQLSIIKRRTSSLGNAASRWKAECNHGAYVKCTRSYSTELWPDAYERASYYLFRGHGCLTKAQHKDRMGTVW